MTILIGISGQFESGKSEILNIIKNIEGGHRVGNINFSDSIYEIERIIQDFLGIGHHRDSTFLQIIGTEWGRVKDPLMWVNYFLKSFDKIKNLYDVIICDDIQFDNEFIALKERGFNMVKVTRASRDRIIIDDKISIPFDFYIENNSSYDDFVYVVSEMYLDIKENLCC